MLSFAVSVPRAIRHMLLVTGIAALAAAPMQAQVAPQLLPYTSKLIAGGATAQPSYPGTCPISGNATTDAYGDGCLATEILLVSARYAAADANGNVFFTDYTNGLVRRVDVNTGIVTAVAGGATSSPGNGVTCGTHTSTDALGDGCLGTAVKLSHPTGLVFSPAGDLYFGDYGLSDVRKIAATNGFITTSGVISLVDGNVSGTYGYTSGVNAATASYLDAPFGLAFDTAGNLYIADEAKEAVMVLNTNTTGSTTVTGVSIPAGQVVKILGSPTAGGSVCPNYPASPNGCNYGTFTPGNAANSSEVDAPYAVTFDPSGNVYVANEYETNGIKITPAGLLYVYGGEQGSYGKVLKRAQEGTFAIDSPFGIVADANSNVYLTDAGNGVIWRIDGSTGNSMYVVAGGGTVCSAKTDTYGDGCPATQATFGHSGTGYATTTAPAPGIYGITEDANFNLYVGDTETALIREIASGTQFGDVGASGSTQTLDIHFATNDLPAGTTAYVLTSGASVFTLGTATCTTNSDATTDCLLPVTATPTALGAFSGQLQVTSSLGATATFNLNGVYVMSPQTRTSVGISSTSATGCGNTTIYATTAPITMTATITSTGSPTGTVTFYANGTAISAPGNPATVSGGVATLTYVFGAVNTYDITAVYSGDTYFTTSTTKSSTNFSTSNPSLALSPVTASTQYIGGIVPGETGLYSFTIAQNVYNGTISFSCSGLPAGAACVFNPSTITATGCSVNNTVAVSVTTTQGSAASSFGPIGRSPWSILAMIAGLGMALLIGVRRSRSTLRFGQLWLVMALLLATSGLLACGSGGALIAGTPAGSYSVTVTAAGSTGSTAQTIYTLKVN